MAQKVYEYGVVEVVVPAGEKIAVSATNTPAKVYQKVGFPNFPDAWEILDERVLDEEYLSSAFTSDTTVKIEAGANGALYAVGAAPQIAEPISDLTFVEDPGNITGLAAAQGGAITITGGASSTAANAGGAINVVGGTPGATGVGGAINITTGAGGSTSGNSGALTMKSANETGTDASGTVSLQSGTTANAISGNVTIGSGNSSANNSGNLTLQTGTASGTAGIITLKTGANTGWIINASGAFVAGTDATYDIGNAASDPRDVNLTRDVVFRKEANHSVKVTDSTTATVAGGNLSLTAGAGNTTGAGGNNTMVAGAGGATGVGGNIVITSGAGGATSGVSGNVTISSGLATANSGSATGNVVVKSSVGANSSGATAAGASGTLTISTGDAGNNTGGATGQIGGAAGNIAITGGLGGNTNSAAAHNAGAGADITLTAGAGGNATAGTGNGGAGGSVILTPGNGGTSVGGLAGVSGMVIARGVFGQKQFTVAAKTTSSTLAAADVLSGIITVNQGGGAPSAQQLPLATGMDSTFPDFATDDAFDFSVINISAVAAETASITTNAGWTLVGNMLLAANTAVTDNSQGRFRARKTGAGAWTLYRIS